MCDSLGFECVVAVAEALFVALYFAIWGSNYLLHASKGQDLDGFECFWF